MDIKRSRNESFRNRMAAARNKGLTLIETALALAVMALVVASLSLMMAENADQVRARATADKLVEVHEAAKGYVKANYAALLAATAGGPVVVPSGRPTAGAPVPAGPAGLPSLQGGGYLPTSYVDVNGYGQRHSLIVRRLGTNGIEALVSTHGGRAIPDGQLGRIATLAGAAGGFMPASNAVAADAGQVVGSYGGWRTPANTWGPAATRPSVGHVAATLAFEDGNLLTDYLYRNDIGIPEANRMNTAIDMNGNDINNIRDAFARNLAATNDVTAGRNLSAGNDLSVGRHATVGGEIMGLPVNPANPASERELDVRDRLSVGTDLTVGRNASIAGNASVGNNLDVTLDADVGRNLDVIGKTTTGDLKSTRMNIDAIVYNDTPGANNRGLSVANGVRLGDLLPRMVPQFSYRVIEASATVVPKPNCAGNYARARVMVFRQTESNRAFPDTDLQTQMVPVNGAGSVVGRVWQGTGANADVTDSVTARDNGLTWTIQWTGLSSVPGTPRQAIAQTMCFYG